MTLTKFTNLLAIGLALSFAGVGCKTGKTGNTPLPPSAGTTSDTKDIGDAAKLPTDGTAVTDSASKMGGGELPPFNPDDMNQDRAALAAQTIYFDYDSASIKADEHSKLAAVAAALQSDSAAKLLIEGDCDERGTEEYNRSLGERRALAAREALAVMGVDTSRVATRSYGEDRPANPGHDQTAWSKNRRDEFVLLHAK